MTGPLLGAVDVCAWTRPNDVDWHALVDRGVRLALIRASDGTSIDRACPEHVARARAVGLPVALWTFFRPSQPAAPQAAELARASLALSAQGVPWLDCEYSAGLVAPALRDAIRCALWELDDLLDRPAGLYTGPDFWTSRVAGVGGDVTEFRARALWVAHYGTAAPTIPRPWTDAAMWQFAGNVQTGLSVLDHDAILWPLSDVLAGKRAA